MPDLETAEQKDEQETSQENPTWMSLIPKTWLIRCSIMM